jgi:hypothetical protein
VQAHARAPDVASRTIDLKANSRIESRGREPESAGSGGAAAPQEEGRAVPAAAASAGLRSDSSQGEGAVEASSENGSKAGETDEWSESSVWPQVSLRFRSVLEMNVADF